MSGVSCNQCGSNKIEEDYDSGRTVCTNCGSVISENAIINEVQFSEQSSNKRSVQGRFISTDGTGRQNDIVNSRGNYFGQGKEVTLKKAKKRILGVCQNLRLNATCGETAFNMFKIALNKGLTKGRKSDTTLGACIYITCRTNQTSHMLIDISDAMQTDFYELGRTYLKLSTELYIYIPAMDPCLYICRFANKLNFGDKTHVVTETALRIVQRMKTDWMHTGRRPSGLCGAALIIAGRFHDFDITVKDATKVVRVHESTLRKRLNEFGETPSSGLSLEDFVSANLEQEEDPPSFRAARKKELEVIMLENDYDCDLIKIQSEIEQHLEESRKKKRGIWAKYDKPTESMTNQESSDMKKFIEEQTLESIGEILSDNSTASFSNAGIGPSTESLGIATNIDGTFGDSEITNTAEQSNALDNEDDGMLDITDLDDDELDYYILSDPEKEKRTIEWTSENKDYLEEQKLKEEREKEEAEQRIKEGKPPKKRQTKPKNKSTTPANSAGDAISQMLIEKKLSSKINYDVLRSTEENETKEVESNVNPINFLKDVNPAGKLHGIRSVLQSIVNKSQNLEEDNFTSPPNKMRKISNSVSDSHEFLSSTTQDVNMEEDKEEEEEEEEESEEEQDEQDMSIAKLLQKRGVYQDDDYDDDY